jgi:hypothetical protein
MQSSHTFTHGCDFSHKKLVKNWFEYVSFIQLFLLSLSIETINKSSHEEHENESVQKRTRLQKQNRMQLFSHRLHANKQSVSVRKLRY